MTVKELYEWALKNDALDCELTMSVIGDWDDSIFSYVDHANKSKGCNGYCVSLVDERFF